MVAVSEVHHRNGFAFLENMIDICTPFCKNTIFKISAFRSKVTYVAKVKDFF